MVRSSWKLTLVVTLVWGGLVGGQQPQRSAYRTVSTDVPATPKTQVQQTVETTKTVPAVPVTYMVQAEPAQPPELIAPPKQPVAAGSLVGQCIVVNKEKCVVIQDSPMANGWKRLEVQSCCTGCTMVIDYPPENCCVSGAACHPSLCDRLSCLFHRDPCPADCGTCQPCVPVCKPCQPCVPVCKPCKPCEKPVCQTRPVPCTGTPDAKKVEAPAHVSLWRRLFMKDQTPVLAADKALATAKKPEAKSETTKTEKAEEQKTAKAGDPEKAKPATKLPSPADLRKSWGKTDEPAQAKAKTPAKGDETKSSKSEETKSSKSEDAKVKKELPKDLPKEVAKAPVKEATKTPPPKQEVAKAETKKPDPLQTPEKYARRAEVKADVKEMQPSPLLAHQAEAKKAAATKEVKPGTATTTTMKPPLGSASVLAAYSGQQGPYVYLPVPLVTVPNLARMPQAPQPNAPNQPPQMDPGMVNAFSQPQMVQAAYGEQGVPFNAFTSGQPQMPMGPMMGAPMGPMGPMGPMMGAPMGAPGMNGGYPAAYMPTPYGLVPMGGQPQPGMAPAGFNPQQMQQMQMQMQQMQMQQMQMMPGMVGNAAATGQLLMTLKEALYPSQREWAAGALVSIDWRMQPQVVDALVLAAREDPAATVRATCVHSLAKMRCTTPTVVAVIQGLKTDADPRVRKEADQALVSLGVPQPASPVQPASAVESEEKSESVISDQ